MAIKMVLLKAIGKVAVNLMGGGLLEVAAEVVPDLCEEVWKVWHPDRDDAEQQAELEELAQAPPEEVRRQVKSVVAEVAGDRPPAVQEALGTYLGLVPMAVRRSLRRPSDPTGATVPAGLRLRKAADLLAFLPPKLPRFKAGQRPLPGIDWELTELLGIGGFGEVWKAKNPHFPGIPPVALKFCLDMAARDYLLRHEAEVLDRVMRQGKHPGIVALQHTYLSADPPCLEYEYVEGGDLTGLILEWHLGGKGPQPREAARVIFRLAEIVGFAHQAQPPIVHRDLKPANVLLTRGPDGRSQFKITDFGIGSVAAGQSIQKTTRKGQQPADHATAVRGAYTPLYASPQQVKGEPPDPRDDVHALGVIWYQLLTGDLTAGAPSGTKWPQRLRDKGMSGAEIDLLAACIEPQPEDRPADAAVLAGRLAAILEEPAAAAAPPPRPALPKPPPPPEPFREERVAVRRPGRRWAGLVVFLGLGVAGLGAATMLLLGRPIHRPEGPEVVPVEKQAAIKPPPTAADQAMRITGTYKLPTIGPQVTTSLGMVLQEILPGTFTMGANTSAENEGPEHRVTLARPYFLATTEVTQAQYQRVMGDNPSKHRHPDYPVENVTWDQAREFCAKLTDLPAEKAKGHRYRLPTEAEWECACRAPDKTPVPKLLGELAWFAGNAQGHPWAVGKKAANAWGFFDLQGNAAEWCADWFDAHFYRRRTDGSAAGPTFGQERVARGGSFQSPADSCRATARIGYPPDFHKDFLGFRVAMTRDGK